MRQVFKPELPHFAWKVWWGSCQGRAHGWLRMRMRGPNHTCSRQSSFVFETHYPILYELKLARIISEVRRLTKSVKLVSSSTSLTQQRAQVEIRPLPDRYTILRRSVVHGASEKNRLVPVFLFLSASCETRSSFSYTISLKKKDDTNSWILNGCKVSWLDEGLSSTCGSEKNIWVNLLLCWLLKIS